MGSGEGLEPQRRAQQQVCRGQSGEIPAQWISANQNSPIWVACLHTYRDGWGLGAEAQALEVRSQGEDWGWLSEDSLKEGSAPQLARRESGKKTGPAEKARDHSFGVHEERGLLPHVPTEGRALPKWAPESGLSHGYQLRRQRQAGNAKAAATKNSVRKHRSLPTPPREPVQHRTAKVMISRDNFPGRTHGMLQVAAMSCRPLPPQAHPAFQLWLLYTSLSPTWVTKRALISCCFNPPSCLGGEQTPEGDLHTEAGPKPKLNPRSWANKEEKGKSLFAASGATD